MKQTGHPLVQGPIAGPYDAIVIGSGIGGLAAAALLAKHAQKRVLVLERHDAAGGFTHTFRRPGYEWDVGVHYIGGVNQARSATRAAFDHLTGGRLQWSPMPEIYDRIRIGGRTYDFPAGVERFRDRMKAYFPGETRAIDRYIAAVCSVVRDSNLYFAEKAIPAPLAFLIGGMLRFRFLRQADRTTAQVLDQFTKNRELIAVLTGQWGNYGLPPSQSSFAAHAIVAHHYFEGAGYPVGGASEIAAAIAPLIESAGGQIATKAEVGKILLDRGNRAIGVCLADGREIRAPLVISDAGAHTTYTQLLPVELPETLSIRRDLGRVPPSMSHYCLYVGLTRNEGEPEFGSSNLWIFPDSDHDGSLQRYTGDPNSPFPMLFISFPSAKDPTFSRRYPGRSTLEIIAPASYARFQPWAETRWKKRPDEYEALKQSLSVRLLDELDRHVPATRGRVAHAELSTPLSTRHFGNWPHGEVYGLSAVPARYRIRNLGVRTPIRNLYLTGQDAGAAGVTGALSGGVLAASAILGRNLMSVVRRTPKT
jgi:all-trans-retinol 13,14-reductase